MGPPGAPFPTGPLLAVMVESVGVRLTFGDASVSVVADWLRDNCPCPECRIVQTDEEVSDDSPKLDIKFKTGDRVKVKDGTFEGFEGEVGTIDAQSGKVQVMISIFGRSTPVELEYWQVEGV